MKKTLAVFAVLAILAVTLGILYPAGVTVIGTAEAPAGPDWDEGVIVLSAPESTQYNDFPSYWEFDVGLVEAVQRRLNAYGFPVDVDGKFGHATGQAVKDWQLAYGQAVTGVVDDLIAQLMGVENWPRGSTMYYMADLTKARHTYVVYVALGGRSQKPHLGLFYDGQLIAESACITGAQDKGFFTPVGVHGVSKKSNSRTGDGYVYYNQTWLKVDGKATQIAVHSLLHAEDGGLVPGQRLGTQVSDGCIRVPDDLAAWLRAHLPVDNTDIIIDDRAWSPASVGYAGLGL